MILSQLKPFNERQKDTLRSMEGSFQDGGWQEMLPWLFVIVIIVLIVIGLASIELKRNQFQGFFIRIKKRIKGTYRPNERFNKKASVSVLRPFGPDRVEHTQTVNISVGGMFVRMIDPLLEGDIFEFYLDVGDGERMRAEAEVVWVQKKWSDHHPSGVGCRFRNLSAKNKNRIRLFLRQ